MPGNVVKEIDELVKIKTVLISVFDKSGLEALVPGLLRINPEVKILSTGGTFVKIESILGKGSPNLVQVSDYTGQPETQGGLVKTLDFKIYLGLLTETYNDAHQDDLRRTDAASIDMVVVNLYPFEQVTSVETVTVEEARANIDIGGPCMLRASAKNFIRVASVTDPVDYSRILDAMEKSEGCLGLDLRFDLAKKAFDHTARYDTVISGFLNKRSSGDVQSCYNLMK